MCYQIFSFAASTIGECSMYFQCNFEIIYYIPNKDTLLIGAKKLINKKKQKIRQKINIQKSGEKSGKYCIKMKYKLRKAMLMSNKPNKSVCIRD